MNSTVILADLDRFLPSTKVAELKKHNLTKYYARTMQRLYIKFYGLVRTIQGLDKNYPQLITWHEYDLEPLNFYCVFGQGNAIIYEHTLTGIPEAVQYTGFGSHSFKVTYPMIDYNLNKYGLHPKYQWKELMQRGLCYKVADWILNDMN